MKRLPVDKFYQALTMLPIAFRKEYENSIQQMLSAAKESDGQSVVTSNIFLPFSPLFVFIDYSLLNHMITKFGSAELKCKMALYIEDVKLFMKKTTVHDLIDHWPGCEVSNLNYGKLKAKFRDDPMTYTLERLNKFRRSFCSQVRLSELIFCVISFESTESFFATWIIPAAIIPELSEAIQQLDESFFEEEHIISILVDQKQLYPSTVIEKEVAKTRVIYIEHYLYKGVISGEWGEVSKLLTGIEISTLPEKLKGLIEQQKELATSILSPALAICKEKPELAEKIQKIKNAMIRTAKVSKTIIILFSDFSEIKERIPDVKESIRNQHSVCQLTAFMEDMNDILSPALEKCSDIQKECELQKDECLQLAKLASVKADETDSTRTATQVGGGHGSGIALAGASAAAVTAVGVVGSVVAGVFTMGIGTVVGLAVTAGGVATVLGTAGITGAAVTAYSANSLHKNSEALRKLSKDSQAMSKNATSFDSEVIELQTNIEKAVTALKSLKRRGTQPDMKEEMIVVTCQTLDRLNTSAKHLSESVQACKEIFKDLEKQLKDIDIEI
jgi:hypothetical protein